MSHIDTLCFVSYPTISVSDKKLLLINMNNVWYCSLPRLQHHLHRRWPHLLHRLHDHPLQYPFTTASTTDDRDTLTNLFLTRTRPGHEEHLLEWNMKNESFIYHCPFRFVSRDIRFSWLTLCVDHKDRRMLFQHLASHRRQHLLFNVLQLCLEYHVNDHFQYLRWRCSSQSIYGWVMYMDVTRK